MIFTFFSRGRFETAIHGWFSRHRWFIYRFLVGILSSHRAFL